MAHGGLIVNGKLWPWGTYLWRWGDIVIEGLDINFDGHCTPLSSFGGKLNMQNVFGCYVSPHIRKKRSPRTFFLPESSKDTFWAMFVALYARLKRYEAVKDCLCITEIIIYNKAST